MLYQQLQGLAGTALSPLTDISAGGLVPQSAASAQQPLTEIFSDLYMNPAAGSQEYYSAPFDPIRQLSSIPNNFTSIDEQAQELLSRSNLNKYYDQYAVEQSLESGGAPILGYQLKPEYAEDIATVRKVSPQIRRTLGTAPFVLSEPYGKVLSDHRKQAYLPGIGYVTPMSNIPSQYLPQKESGGLGGLLGIAASLMLGPAGSGLLPAWGASAVGGGLSALANDQDVLTGALTGGLGGAMTQFGGPAISEALGSAGVVDPFVNQALTMGLLGGGNALITGGDIGQGMLGGALGGGLNNYLSSIGVPRSLVGPLSSALVSKATGRKR